MKFILDFQHPIILVGSKKMAGELNEKLSANFI